MISRLVLVGMVAVLGVSLPSQPERGGWFTAARAWAIAQLADWDTCSARQGDSSCIVEESPRTSRPAAIQASMRTTASVAFEPVPVDELLDTGIASEQNCLAGGPDIPPTTTTIAEAPSDFTPAPSSDSIELKLVVELCRISEGSVADGTLSLPMSPQHRETGPADTVAEMSPENPEADDPSAEELAATIPTESLSHPARPEFEPIKPLASPTTDGADELNRLSDGIEDRPEAAAIQSARPKFDPIELPLDLESGLAYELNRASDGLEIISPEARRLGDSQPRIPEGEVGDGPEANNTNEDTNISKAIRLTRDAVFAWMDVLTGPALVTLRPH